MVDTLLPQAPAAPEPARTGPSRGKDFIRPAYQLYRTLEGHSMAVVALSFSPDETLLASASADTTAKVWCPFKGICTWTLEGHTKGLSDICWDSTGKYLCTASDDFTLKLWGLEEKACLRTLEGHTNHVFCCCFSPKGSHLISGSFDETVRVWDTRTGHCLREIPAHSDPVTAVDYHRDGTLILSCSYDGLTRIWNTEDGKCVKTLMDDTQPPVVFARFSPNGKYVLTASLDSTLKLWEYDKCRLAKRYNGHVNKMHCIFASFGTTDRKGKWILCGSEEASVHIWHLNSREQHAQELPGKESKEAEGDGHCDAVLAISCHPRRAMFATGALQKDCTIKLWVDKSDPSITADMWQE